MTGFLIDDQLSLRLHRTEQRQRPPLTKRCDYVLQEIHSESAYRALLVLGSRLG
jgi:hypothetical protein